jgi:predicted MFS family arabinose efflux permease
MDKISKKNTLRRVKLSRCYRLFLFYIVISVEGAMNISAGLMSSATKEIKQSLNMNDAKFGMFGTLNGIGRVIGSTLFGMYNLTVSRKWIQTICVGFHAIFLLFFKLTNNGNILIFMRGLTGFTQMPPSIYCCVWIDQYGLQAFKTLQITAVQLFQTTGKCIGFFLNMYF